jgi:polysaccharide biosynthesis protein PslH
MSALLYLVHRIPFPPNKGDKIRSFHLLQALCKRYEVHLGSFIDTPEDEQHLPALRELCAEVFVARLRPRWARLASARALLTGEPLTNAYYASPSLARWVRRTLSAHNIRHVVMFSSSMGQFVPAELAAGCRCVIDFCDIDSDKWRQYAQRQGWPLSAVYAREARTLERTEIELARRFDASLFVSDQEAGIFRRLVPERAAAIHAVRNGVDAAYFDPEHLLDESAVPKGRNVVFTGAMDYWANVEGVSWFVREIWPAVRSAHPDANFLIVGSRPAPAVLEFASAPGVIVTGAVADVRPFVRSAHVSVAPLRIARGVQNKVLEAMAMKRYVVAAPAALQGIDAPLPGDVLAASAPEAFAAALSSALQSAQPRVSDANRRFVLDHYDWARNLASFMDSVGAGRAGSSSAAAA